MIAPAFAGLRWSSSISSSTGRSGDLDATIHALSLRTTARVRESDDGRRDEARSTARCGDNKIVVYMKGTPSFPMCGFSAATVEVLDEIGVPVQGRRHPRGDREARRRQGLLEVADDPAGVRGREVHRRVRHRARDARARRAGAAAAFRGRRVALLRGDRAAGECPARSCCAARRAPDTERADGAAQKSLAGHSPAARPSRAASWSRRGCGSARRTSLWSSARGASSARASATREDHLGVAADVEPAAGREGVVASRGAS